MSTTPTEYSTSHHIWCARFSMSAALAHRLLELGHEEPAKATLKQTLDEFLRTDTPTPFLRDELMKTMKGA